MFERTRMFFSNVRTVWASPSDKVVASRTLTTDLAAFLIDMSNFKDKPEAEIIEQIYKVEPEVGGSIDRMSTMTGDAFKGFVLRNTGDELDDLEEEMIRIANEEAETTQVREWFEALAEVLFMHGNLYTYEDPTSLTIEILPNRSITILDDLNRKLADPKMTQAITKANYIIIDEGSTEERVIDVNFRITKYKSTPIWAKDNKERDTFGIYSSSPVYRTILNIWQKRQLQIIDVLWRYKMIPREHHQFSAEMFNMANYAGDLNTKRNSARADAESIMGSYAQKIKQSAPDIGYVTLDTTKITTVEPKSAGYMAANEIIAQLNNQIFIALTTPKSILAGGASGSYASELVVTNYVAIKVISLANKIKPIILENMRKRLSKKNGQYPVDKLDIKIDMILSNSKLELYRQAAIMGALGVFDESEIRDLVGYEPLREDQREHIVQTGNMTVQANANEPSVPAGEQQPETSQSSNQHATDKGKAVTNKAERK
jgi:hypothetical protein